MAAKPNLLDLGLSKEEDELVKRGAALYKASVLEAFDNVFVIARAIEVLQKRNYGKGVQGGFTIALVQCGFTSRDGMKPINPSIRNAYKGLLENETAVREWWDTQVPDDKKDLWLSARAIHRNWKNSTNKPKQSRKPKAPLPQPMTEEEIRERSAMRPSKDAAEAKQAAEAEAERRRLDSEEATLDALADAFGDTIDKAPEQERLDVLTKLVARWGYALTVPQQPDPESKPPKKRGSRKTPKKRGSRKKGKAVPAKGDRDAAAHIDQPPR
jgi:hypothetical protein